MCDRKFIIYHRLLPGKPLSTEIFTCEETKTMTDDFINELSKKTGQNSIRLEIWINYFISECKNIKYFKENFHPCEKCEHPVRN